MQKLTQGREILLTSLLALISLLFYFLYQEYIRHLIDRLWVEPYIEEFCSHVISKNCMLKIDQMTNLGFYIFNLTGLFLFCGVITYFFVRNKLFTLMASWARISLLYSGLIVILYLSNNASLLATLLFSLTAGTSTLIAMYYQKNSEPWV